MQVVACLEAIVGITVCFQQQETLHPPNCNQRCAITRSFGKQTPVLDVPAECLTSVHQQWQHGIGQPGGGAWWKGESMHARGAGWEGSAKLLVGVLKAMKGKGEGAETLHGGQAPC
eukprot:scaffold136858_cov16-Tisochrysis_lutea.AAC.1